MSYKVKIELDFNTYKPNEEDIFTYIKELYEDNSLDYELINNKNRKENMKLHDIREQGIYNRIITASNFVIGDNGTKESKEILNTFIELVKLSEEEYQIQKELHG